VLIDANLKTGKRDKKTELAGSHLERQRCTLDYNAILEEEEEEEEEE